MSDGNHLDTLLGAQPRQHTRHWMGVLILIAAAVGAGTFFIKFLVGTDSAYYSEPLVKGNLVPLVSENGVLRSDVEFPVRSAVAGIVMQAPGLGKTQVAQGDILATLDTQALKTAIAMDHSQLSSAVDDLAAARVASNEARVRLARFTTVWRKSQGRVPSLNEMETARSQAAQAELAEDAATHNVDAAKLQLKRDLASLDGAVSRAPADGVVVSSALHIGQHVNAGDILFTLGSAGGKLHVDVHLPIAPTGPIKAGTIAKVRIDDMPDKVQSATLSRILISPPGQPEARIAQFTLEHPLPGLRPGQAVTVEIALPQRTNVLLVPNSALKFDPAGSGKRKRESIYLLSRGEPHRVYVSKGGSDGTRTEIFANDLHPGDQVITGWRKTSSQREP